jgi:NTP pyrophosphatase (non-canonical NTP hydrolase)
MAFNGLSDAEDERLTCVMEECGEVVQIICKIQRHGYDSCHPEQTESNREALEREIGDLMARVELLTRAGELSKSQIVRHAQKKLAGGNKYMHHQP